MRITAWAALSAAAIAMIVGHLGEPGLSWTRNQISTYAARAPNDAWITAAMLFAALTFLCLGICISAHAALGRNPLRQVGAMAFGAAMAGLCVLARFEETATSIMRLENMPFGPICQQTLHDAGLLVFVFGSIAGMVISGLFVLLQGPGWIRRMLGVALTAVGPIAYVAMKISWPEYLGFAAGTAGMRQRVSLLFLWVGAALLLALMPEKAREKST